MKFVYLMFCQKEKHVGIAVTNKQKINVYTRMHLYTCTCPQDRTRLTHLFRKHVILFRRLKIGFRKVQNMPYAVKPWVWFETRTYCSNKHIWNHHFHNATHMDSYHLNHSELPCITGFRFSEQTMM